MAQRSKVWKGEYFSIVEHKGYKGIEFNKSGAAILPYKIGEDGFISSVGALKEYNPNWNMDLESDEERHIASITGSIDPEDSSVLAAAMRELLEETGYNVESIENWKYLGICHTSKISTNPIHLFAVNCDGVEEPQEKKGDGTEQEEKSSFHWMDPKTILTANDSILCVLYIRLFSSVYKPEIIEPKPEPVVSPEPVTEPKETENSTKTDEPEGEENQDKLGINL